MYGCGLRIGEAVRLEVGAVDSEHGVLRIVAGKGGRDRRVSLPLPILEALRVLWRTHRHPRWLFPNRRGTGPVDTDVIAATFRAAAAEAGIRDRITAHVAQRLEATDVPGAREHLRDDLAPCEAAVRDRAARQYRD